MNKQSKWVSMFTAMALLYLLLPAQAFANSIVEESSGAQNATCIVVFDPDDGETAYGDFYGITVSIGERITARPQDPEREGYLFKGWYSHLDGNDHPVLWDFANDTVVENTTLWAAWEAGRIVAFDPDDGEATYAGFHRITVPIGERITARPQDPEREGYLFKGWYSHLDGNDQPVLWDFASDTVMENTTLWAAWQIVDTGNGGSSGSDNGSSNRPGGGSADRNQPGAATEEGSEAQSGSTPSPYTGIPETGWIGILSSVLFVVFGIVWFKRKNCRMN